MLQIQAKAKEKEHKKRKECEKMKTKWTKQKAEEYIRKCKEKGLKYWSARDYLKNHKTMHSIIQKYKKGNNSETKHSKIGR